MKQTSYIVLNLRTPNYATVYAAQDNLLSRYVNATLLDGDAPWTIPANTYMEIAYIKPDGTGGIYDSDENNATAYTFSGNTVEFVLAQQALTVPGNVLMALHFFNANDEQLSSFTFMLTVPQSSFPYQRLESADYFNIMQGTLADMAAAGDRALAKYNEYLEDLADAYSTYDTQMQAAVAAAEQAKQYAQTFTGAPRTMATATGFANADHDLIYVFTGTTDSSYTNGHWYYWNGTAWTDGGAYNSSAINTDTTLSVSGMPADAAACGDLKSAFNTILTEVAFTPNLNKGSYWNADGSTGNSNKYVRTSSKWNGKGVRNAIGLDSNTYEFGLFFFDENNNGDGSVARGSTKLAYIPSAYFVINFKRIDNEVITDSDVTAISGLLKAYAIADKTLTLSDIPADAKATGEAISNLSDNVKKLNEITDIKDYIQIDFGECTSGNINYTNGNVNTSQSLSHTDYIDLEGYKRIKYKRIFSTLESPTSGIAFYDSEKTYIGGIPAIGGADTAHYEDYVASVPNNAKYVRFTTFMDTTTYGDFELYGQSILYDSITSAKADLSNAVKNFSDSLFVRSNGFTDSLRQNSVSFSTGAIGPGTSGIYCSCDFTSYKTDLVLNLGLSDYLWHAWSYSRNSGSYATHSNTDRKLVDGVVPIFIKKNIADAYYVFEIRRKDGEELTTDTTDPTSDYSIIANALKITEMHPVYDYYGGNIFRLESETSSVPVGEDALGYEEFLAQTWDTLASDYSSSVTKTAIGVSSTTEEITTEYNIYKYVFTPRDYEKTVFLSAGCHGNEYEGFWGLYRLMRLIYDYGYKYPNLWMLRTKVRFVIVPVWNPWGVQNRVRNCPLGFPTQENLNTEVTVDDVTYPAFTSKECQAIKAVFDEYEGEISFWADMHTDPFSSVSGYKKGCYGYAPGNSAINRVLYALTIAFRQMIRDDLNYRTTLTIYDTNEYTDYRIPGYGVYRGVPSTVIETTINEYAESGSSTLMKYAIEWYGNVIASMIAVT